jgi:RNA polymerase sigma factor (sigma-70 family)
LTGVYRPASEVGAQPTSFDRLFDEEYARVVAIARRVLGDADAAEDVAQEVFLDLHRRFGDNPGARASAWARTAAAHLALNTIRTNRRRAGREERYAVEPSPGGDPQAAVEVAETTRARPNPEESGHRPRPALQRAELCRDCVGAGHRGERSGDETTARGGAPSQGGW